MVLGLLSDLPRKNCWSIAEWAGEARPDGMQLLLGRARWDADRVRDHVREYVLEHLHDENTVLVVDETGDVKKGHAHRRRPAPVHRHRREDRKRAGRRLPRLRRTARARGGGPGAVHPALLDARPRSLPSRGPGRGHRLRDQAGAGRPHDRPTSRCLAPRRLGRGMKKSRAATRSCAPHWKSARTATCSPSPAHMKSPPAQGSSARMPWPRRCPSGPGRSCRTGPGPRGTASTTGRSSIWPNPASAAASC